MNNLTLDVTRLCSEIVALREGRVALRAGRATFLRQLAATTQDMQEAVSDLLGVFGTGRANRAEQSRQELGGFVARVREDVGALKRNVDSFRENFRDDLAGARRAWSNGGAVPERSPRPAHDHFAPAEPKAKKRRR